MPRPPLLVTGSTGTLGFAFARLCEVRGLEHLLTTREQMDIAGRGRVIEVLRELHPWAVVNTAGFVRVDDAEAAPDRCRRENTEGAAELAGACAELDLPLVTFSSDLVFDGAFPGAPRPYVESDATAPLNVYGHTKEEAERVVLMRHPAALVVRTSAFFGPWDAYNFVTLALTALRRGERFVAADDAVISPTYLPDLVNQTLDLLLDSERGIWHLANRGAITWADLARTAAERAGVSADGVEGRHTATLALPAARPAYSVLGSERGLVMPDLDSALDRYTARS
jgi:dTDP-4-dehydrorhamnose reductase